MLVPFGLLAAIGAACAGCSAPSVTTTPALDNPANPAAAAVPYIRPANLLAAGAPPVTSVPSTAMRAMASGDMASGDMAGMDHAAMGRSGTAANVQMAEAGGGQATATGTVNAVDAAKHSVNISHQPIKALGWPSMTMDFPVARSIDLSAVKPGDRIGFTLGRPAADGTRPIEQIKPAASMPPSKPQ